MTFKDFIENLLIVVVIYKKKISDCETILSISSSLADRFIDILVYDNSPEYNQTATSVTENCRLYYVADNDNSGVSKAYNSGAKKAQDMKKRWLLLCDQDTVLTLNYFQEVFTAVHIHCPPLVAPFLYSEAKLISPCAFIFNYGFALRRIPVSGWNNFKNLSVLNSGLLIKLEAFEKLGGYNEDIFLDFSDFDFIKRYKKMFSQFYLINTRVEHHLESSVHGSFNELRFIKYCKSYRRASHNFFILSQLV